MHQLLLFPNFAPTSHSPPPLITREQQDLLEILLHGGSPQVACARLNLPTESFSSTLAKDQAFRQKLAAVHQLMTHNVIATIYAAALKGTPTAQSLWMKTFPPPHNANTDTEHETNELDVTTQQQLRDWLALRPADHLATTGLPSQE